MGDCPGASSVGAMTSRDGGGFECWSMVCCVPELAAARLGTVAAGGRREMRLRLGPAGGDTGGRVHLDTMHHLGSLGARQMLCMLRRVVNRNAKQMNMTCVWFFACGVWLSTRANMTECSRAELN